MTWSAPGSTLGSEACCGGWWNGGPGTAEKQDRRGWSSCPGPSTRPQRPGTRTVRIWQSTGHPPTQISLSMLRNPPGKEAGWVWEGMMQPLSWARRPPPSDPPGHWRGCWQQTEAALVWKRTLKFGVRFGSCGGGVFSQNRPPFLDCPSSGTRGGLLSPSQ